MKWPVYVNWSSGRKAFSAMEAMRLRARAFPQ